VKFSELLGEPEPDPEQADPAQPKDVEPISVFAPVPTSPPPGVPPLPGQAPPLAAPLAPPPGLAPAAGRSGLAELNVRRPLPEAPAEPSALADQLIGLTEVDDDLLPSGRRNRK
jgi:hypothetical protein